MTVADCQSMLRPHEIGSHIEKPHESCTEPSFPSTFKPNISSGMVLSPIHLMSFQASPQFMQRFVKAFDPRNPLE